jgi:hypothetical protein
VRLLRAGLSIVVVGMSRFIAAGVLQVVRKGLNDASIAVAVDLGCPNGTSTEFSGKVLCSHPAPYIYSDVTDNDVTRIVFWGFGCLLALANYLLIAKVLRDPGEHFARQSLVYQRTALSVTAVTVLLAISNASADPASVTEQYYDCRNATQQSDGTWIGCVSENLYFPGSPSGFWDVWVKFYVVVLQGIFAW